jgi:hypothetical protein
MKIKSMGWGIYTGKKTKLIHEITSLLLVLAYVIQYAD